MRKSTFVALGIIIICIVLRYALDVIEPKAEPKPTLIEAKVPSLYKNLSKYQVEESIILLSKDSVTNSIKNELEIECFEKNRYRLKVKRNDANAYKSIFTNMRYLFSKDENGIKIENTQMVYNQLKLNIQNSVFENANDTLGIYFETFINTISTDSINNSISSLDHNFELINILNNHKFTNANDSYILSNTSDSTNVELKYKDNGKNYILQLDLKKEKLKQLEVIQNINSKLNLKRTYSLLE